MADNAVRTQVTELTLSRLARDIARDIVDIPDLLKVHQLTLAQYESILDNKFFQNRLEEEIAAWSADGRARIQAKAMAILEEGLVELYDLIHDKSQAMPAKIEALKFTARLASMSEGAVPIDPQERIVFNITIGGQKHTYEQQREDPKLIEGDATTLPSG